MDRHLGEPAAKVYILSNQVFVRDGIKNFLLDFPDFEVTGSSDVIRDRLGDLEALIIDIVILDLVSVTNPSETIVSIRRRLIDAKIVVFCPMNSKNFAINALDAGAVGIMTHSVQPADLLIAMGRVWQGDNYIQPDIAMEMFREMRAKDAKRAATDRLNLTVRETQVIKHLKLGKTNRQIGESLSISEKTVKHYIGVIKEKFCVSNRLEIVLHAQKLLL
jgi:two-component system nitrate/nitrite response regulator NarL